MLHGMKSETSLRLQAWARFFRIVNLPTVPGDVLAGAAAVCAFSDLTPSAEVFACVASMAVASCFFYLSGLADNDIVGAGTDTGRPIPDGEISLRSARVARAACLLAGFASLAAIGRAALFSLPAVFALIAAIAAYNRTKRPLLMGLCRGLDVLAGAQAATGLSLFRFVRTPGAGLAVAAAVVVWTAYVAAVAKYSEGEELDPRRKRMVGFLVGCIVYLQLAFLVVFTLVDPRLKPLLVAGALLLVALRLSKRLFRNVSAS